MLIGAWWTIVALCRLTCASLTEDSYGVVQRDIPKIIEALLSFLTALEEYQAELTAAHTSPSTEKVSAREAAEREMLAIEAARAGEVLGVVSDGMSSAFCGPVIVCGGNDADARVRAAIKDGIVQIVRTFGDKLSAFKFPPRIARKLQGFVDYN